MRARLALRPTATMRAKRSFAPHGCRAITNGGQILVSEPARDLVVDHLGDKVTLVDLGEHRLRDLARPERVYQVTGPGLSEDFPPLKSLDALRHNLPIQLSSFVGRVDEIATVADLVRSNRLVTIVGGGGSGKTRLALQVAGELADQSKDGTWLIELADVRDPDLAVAAVASAIGVRSETGAGAADALAHVLEELDTLLVLDNCEHLVEAVAPRSWHAVAGMPACPCARDQSRAVGAPRRDRVAHPTDDMSCGRRHAARGRSAVAVRQRAPVPRPCPARAAWLQSQ